MNDLTIFKSDEFGEVRTVVIDGEAWFVAKDVASALGYARPENAVASHIDDDDKTTALIQGTGSNYKSKSVIVNESGVYSLVFGSKLESAKRFKKWITSEVLPKIRKTGKYELQTDSYMIDDPAERARRWAEEYEERKSLQSKVTEMAPKAKVFDTLIDSRMLVNFRDAAKEIGISQSQFTGWLTECGYIYRTPNGELRPMEPYMESGLFQMKPYMNPYNGYTSSRTFITPRGLATFKVILENQGHTRYTMKKHGGKKKRCS